MAADTPPQPNTIVERTTPTPPTPPQPANVDRDKFNVENGAENGGVDSHDTLVVAFEKWLLDSGAKFPLLHMRKYDTEVRGVHAATDIDPDVVIVEVPLRCLITVEMGKATDVGRAVLAADLDLDAPKHVFLMLYLLVDMKRPGSFFRPYYDLLPRTLANMPIFWTQEELRWLEGSYLLVQVQDRKDVIESDYRAICEVYPSFADVATLPEFMWARMVVCSRNFGLIVDGLRTSALVPYADMLNHYRPRETKWTYDNDRGAFTITTLQNIAAGAQVYDSYGQKCNHRFLLNYGFAVENNIEANGYCPNEVPMELQLDESDALYSRKWALWQLDEGPRLRRVRVPVCGCDNEAPRTVLSLLRVIAADVADLAAIEASVRSRLAQTAKDVRFPVGVRNETAAMKLLRDLAQHALANYPASLEEDSRALAEGANLPPFSNRRHALVQVRGEKVVWRHYLALAEAALEALTSPADPAAAAAAASRGKHQFIVEFCTTAIVRVRLQDRLRAVPARSSGSGSSALGSSSGSAQRSTPNTSPFVV